MQKIIQARVEKKICSILNISKTTTVILILTLLMESTKYSLFFDTKII